MLVPLRFQPAEPPAEDAFALLLACHERIRGFFALAVKLARLEEVPPHERAEAATRLERYFSQGLPRHVEDEDLSLAPRILAAGPSAEVLQAILEMTRQHAELDRILANLLPAWRAVAAEPGRCPSELAHDSERLATHLEEHLRLEEQVIFPAARVLLSPGDTRAVLLELRSRRAPAGGLP
jgi:iron-sulfur cluster repair protein YtfE (RIC family)